MTQPDEAKMNSEDTAQTGMRLGITFLLFAILLSALPTYFGSTDVTRGMAFAAALIGTAGLGHELSVVNAERRMDFFRDLGFGFFLVAGCLALALYFDVWWLNIHYRTEQMG
jgi:hypothetical protein